VIEASNLSMSYGSVRALEDASFEVRSGEVLGLLGPNGAGKTTTLKILTTFIQPTSGRVVVDGIDAAEDPLAVRRKIGYLPETAPLYVDMLVGEYLAFVGRARGLEGRRLQERRVAVVESCGLPSVYYRPIGQLSKGFRQRVGLAQALIHDPEIVILDEPTSGLDPLQIRGIRGLVRELARDKTVVFSTHILQEIEAVSDRVMIMNEGRIIAEGSPRSLEERAMDRDRLLVETSADAETAGAALSGLEGVLDVEPREPAADGDCAFGVRHAFGDREVVGRVEALLRGRDWPVRHLAPDRFSLEEVFVALVQERAELRDVGDAADAAAAGGAA
jgi:ABC-2 type transport system ATP-binding protein